MNHQTPILAILPLLFYNVESHDLSPPSPSIPSSMQPSVVIIIGVLSVMLSATFLILAYTKFCQRSTHEDLHQFARSWSRFSGIDKEAIKSLPFFTFSSLRGSKDGLECAVCLSKFQESEVLRLLPKCKHAFHLDCIDEWLGSHSSCPLCRHRLVVAGEFTSSFDYTNSLRCPSNSSSNLMEDPNLELFIERENDENGKEKFPNQESLENGKIFDKFKHRIVVSHIVHRSRWSDVNSSDLMLLNSQMLHVMSSQRFSPSSSIGTRFNGQIGKIKDDLERKRMYESKVGKVKRSLSFSSSSFHFGDSNNEGNHSSSTSTISRLLAPDEKRSMSEITNFSRYREFSVRNRSTGSFPSGRDEKMRKVWLGIARKTVQWFAGRETKSDESGGRSQPINV